VLRGLSGWIPENGDPSILIFFSTPISHFAVDMASIDFQGSGIVFALSGLGPIDAIALVPGSFND
jgi:hypothetical protein